MEGVHQDFNDDIKSAITVNELLQVQTLDDPKSATYYSRVEDFSEGKIVIAWPTSGGIRLPVHRDQMLEFSFVRDGTPFLFTGLVDQTDLAPLPQITVILSSSVMRVQRRENFRIKCLIPLEITGTFKHDPREADPTVQVIKTTTYDLSASGIAIRSAKPFPEGTLLDIKLALPDNGPVIKAPCRVVYCDNLAESAMPYRIGIHYLEISESERARIVRFANRAQLKGLCA
jgi:c-di-GMP-binding flagellar brake protein YcgR